MRPLPKDRFYSKTKAMPSGCLEWASYKTSKGYGRFRYGNKTIKAHRVAWMLAHGEDSVNGVQVLHKCDNPPCVNIDHLFIGDHEANMRDRTAKGRDAAGSAAPMAVLNEESVRAIRVLHGGGGRSHKALGALFGVDKSTISLLLKRKTWAHI